jgi:phosphatidylglycerol:prolipoprotein diacylglycerol transferase
MFYHDLNPILATIGPFQIRWYGIMYALSFVFLYFTVSYLVKRKKVKLTQHDVEWFIVIETLALLIGARIFEVLVYNPGYYISNPIDIIAFWKGGLSFHGGLIGMFVAGYIFCKKKRISTLQMADIFVIPVGIALMLGRIGNFINGELYGRITNVPWCFKFEGAEGCRHPSQLYEAGKNLLIFMVMWAIKDKKQPHGFFFALFLMMYGALRFLIEFVREPELYVGALTMGQFLCVLMIITGGVLMWRLKKK